MKVTVEVEFEVGDVVFLNSDVEFEHPMTVEDLSMCECGIENVDVVFTNCVGDIVRDSFPASCVICID